MAEPCDVFIVVDRRTEKRVDREGANTERRYCEQGEKGHRSTHCGWRSHDRYSRLLKESQRTPT